MKLAFNEQTHIGTNDMLGQAYLGFLSVVSRLAEFSIRRFDFDGQSAVVDFRNYLFQNGAAVVARIGVQNYEKLKTLFVHFLIATQNLKRGDVQVGLNSSPQWGGLSHVTPMGEYLCVTQSSHVEDPVFLRWAFANGLTHFDRISMKMLNHGYKHYKLQGDPPSATRVTRRTAWVRKTDNGEPAQFRPGLAFTGEETVRMLRQLLLSALSKHRLTHTLLNGFVCDMAEVIGASQGEPTTKVKIDITPQDEFHLIPVLC